jgi:hypothetical protein
MSDSPHTTARAKPDDPVSRCAEPYSAPARAARARRTRPRRRILSSTGPGQLIHRSIAERGQRSGGSATNAALFSRPRHEFEYGGIEKLASLGEARSSTRSYACAHSQRAQAVNGTGVAGDTAPGGRADGGALRPRVDAESVLQADVRSAIAVYLAAISGNPAIQRPRSLARSFPQLVALTAAETGS